MSVLMIATLAPLSIIIWQGIISSWPITKSRLSSLFIEEIWNTFKWGFFMSGNFRLARWSFDSFSFVNSSSYFRHVYILGSSFWHGSLYCSFNIQFLCSFLFLLNCEDYKVLKIFLGLCKTSNKILYRLWYCAISRLWGLLGHLKFLKRILGKILCL